MSFVAAETHDVPDDQEVSGEPEFFDELEFALDLRAGAVVVGLIAAARGFASAIAQEVDFRLAVRHGVARKFIAQVRELEWQLRRDFSRIRDGVRGRPQNRRAISAPDFRWRSAFLVSNWPAVARVTL